MAEIVIAVPTRKITLMMRKASFSPRLFASQALNNWLATIVAMNAVAIHCARSCPIPKAPITLGTATLTIVADRIIATAPVTPASVTNQR